MIIGATQVDVSIIVVNWNVAAYLDGCLRSIKDEASRSSLTAETIVVDNASDDKNFREVVDDYPGTRLIPLESNLGYGAACNVGVGASIGTAVLLLNPDTELHAGCLEALWHGLNLAPHVGLIAPLLLNPDGSVQSMGYRFPGPVNVLFDLVPVPGRLYESVVNGRVPAGNGQLPVEIDYALGAALLVRRSALVAIGGFDERFFMYSEEVDFQRRLAASGWTRILAPAARVTHFGGQSTGQQPDAMQMALWESRAAYFERWASARERTMLNVAANLGTRVSDVLRPERRSVNARIRASFRSGLMPR